MNIKKEGMAWIGKVIKISPIDGADRIQKTEVFCGKGGSWVGVTTKDRQEGDIVVVFMPDAVVPQIEPLAFMEKHHWRVKICRLKGCPSEVIILPFEVFKIGVSMNIGEDVTDLLGVLKYEKEIPACMAGETLSNFPSFIPKTDELNFQTVPEFRKALIDKLCYISEKVDGSSLSIYHNNGHIGVCSRNWEKKEDYNTIRWQIVERYKLKENLPRYGNYCLQAELVGPGIQKNRLQLSQVDVRVFDIFNIDTQEYVDMSEARQITKELGMKFVQMIEDFECSSYKNYSDDELRIMAEGIYRGTTHQREGIVIRPVKTMRVDGKRVSFKVINLKYKE